MPNPWEQDYPAQKPSAKNPWEQDYGESQPAPDQPPSVSPKTGFVPTMEGIVSGGFQRVKRGLGRIANPAPQPGTGVEGIIRNVAGGTSDVIRGGSQMATPAMIPLAMAAPLPTVLGTAAAVGSDALIGGAGRMVGLPQEYSDLAGDAAGIFAGSRAAHAVPNPSPFTAAGRRGFAGAIRGGVDAAKDIPFFGKFLKIPEAMREGYSDAMVPRSEPFQLKPGLGRMMERGAPNPTTLDAPIYVNRKRGGFSVPDESLVPESTQVQEKAALTPKKKMRGLEYHGPADEGYSPARRPNPGTRTMPGEPGSKTVTVVHKGEGDPTIKGRTEAPISIYGPDNRIQSQVRRNQFRLNNQ